MNKSLVIIYRVDFNNCEKNIYNAVSMIPVCVTSSDAAKQIATSLTTKYTNIDNGYLTYKGYNGTTYPYFICGETIDQCGVKDIDTFTDEYITLASMNSAS